MISINNLSLNLIKTKQMIVDYRKRRTEHSPLIIDGAVVEQVERFKFLGIHITNKLTWSKHTKTVVKRPNKTTLFTKRVFIYIFRSCLFTTTNRCWH